MPLTIAVDDTRRRITVTTEGIVAYADVVAYLTERRARGLLGHAALVDCDGAGTNLTTAEIRDLVDRRRRLGQDGGVAPTVVVARVDLLFGMMRMYQILIEEQADLFHVVRRRDEAERWLDEVAPVSSA